MSVYIVVSRFKGDRFVACDSKGDVSANDVFHAPIETWLPENIYSWIVRVCETEANIDDPSTWHEIDFGRAGNAALQELCEIGALQDDLSPIPELRFIAVEASDAHCAELMCRSYLANDEEPDFIIADFILDSAHSIDTRISVCPVKLPGATA